MRTSQQREIASKCSGHVTNAEIDSIALGLKLGLKATKWNITTLRNIHNRGHKVGFGKRRA